MFEYEYTLEFYDASYLFSLIDADSNITQTPLEIGIVSKSGDDTTVNIRFASTLGSEETDLNTLITNYDISNKPKAYQGLLSESLSVTDTLIVSSATWQCVGGVTFKPELFTSNLSKCILEVDLVMSTDGSTAQFRITENDVQLGNIDTLSDTSNVDQIESFNLTTPSAGVNSYKLEARLNGITTFHIKFASLNLLQEI